MMVMVSAVIVIVAVCIVVAVRVPVSVTMGVTMGVGMAILMVVMMPVVMAVFMGSRMDFQVNRPDPVTLDPFGRHTIRLTDLQRLQRLENPVQGSPQVDRRPQEHVASDPAEGVNMKMLTHNPPS